MKQLDSTKTKKINKSFAQALNEMDNTDITSIESTMKPIPVSDVIARIRSTKGRFFAVDFARKNDKKKNGEVIEPAGSIRHMVCRRGVKKFSDGKLPDGKRKNEDAVNDVLTVWDVGVYQCERKNGKDQETSGRKSYRRINLADVKAISVAPVEEIETVEA